MKPRMLACTLLLGCSAFVVAQNAPQQDTSQYPSTTTPPITSQTPSGIADQQSYPPDIQDQAQRSSQTSAPSNTTQPTTIEGCLTESAASGHFTLTDRHANTYDLSGSNAEIASHVGQDVQIVGTVSDEGGLSSHATAAKNESGEAKNEAGEVASQGAQETKRQETGRSITVQSISKVSDQCSGTARQR